MAPPPLEARCRSPEHDACMCLPSRAAHVRSVYRGGRAGRLDEVVYSRTGRGGECAWSRMVARASKASIGRGSACGAGMRPLDIASL